MLTVLLRKPLDKQFNCGRCSQHYKYICFHLLTMPMVEMRVIITHYWPMLCRWHRNCDKSWNTDKWNQSPQGVLSTQELMQNIKSGFSTNLSNSFQLSDCIRKKFLLNTFENLKLFSVQQLYCSAAVVWTAVFTCKL